MILSYHAFTYEIDDIEAAVEEILAQLDMDHHLLAHSAGILSCYAEFIDSGVVRALAERLPFPIVGTTTLATAIPEAADHLLLSLLVLTSDDTSFAVEETEPITDNLEAVVQEAYQKAATALGQKPGLMFSFAPLLLNYAGDQYVEALDQASGGVPNFGTITVDHTQDYSECRVICNGSSSNQRIAFLLVGGNPSPAFSMATVSEKNILRQNAIITAADGNILKEVNHQPLAAYLETVGLAKDGKISEGVNSVPFLIGKSDGTQPVARAMFAILPDGSGACGGVMPVGATLSICAMDRQEVLDTSEAAIDCLLAGPPFKTLLIFSCLGRNLALGADPMAELEAMRGKLEDRCQYLICYSGGEICPVQSEHGGLHNRFHNNTLVICAF